MDFIVFPVAIVRHELSDEELRKKFEGIRARVEVLKEYEEALEGLEGFSHLILVSYLNKVDRKPLKVKPKRLLEFGINLNELPEVGVFCTDSPMRPNPIGISVVRFIERKGNVLIIDNCDLFNNTPILDIKPLTLDKIPEKVFFPEWYSALIKLIKDRKGIDLKVI